MRVPDATVAAPSPREVLEARSVLAGVPPPDKPFVSVADLEEVTLSDEQRATLAARAVHATAFGVADRHVRLHFDDPAAAGRIVARYRDVPACGTLSESAYAVREDGELVLWTGNGPAYRFRRSTAPHLSAFFADILATHALLTNIPRAVTLHAAALRSEAGAFAITGVSTAGKSTTAMACIAAGADLYSDERCITVDGIVVPYPRGVNLREDGIERLARVLPEGDFRARIVPLRGADREALHFDELTGRTSFPAPAPLRAIFAVVGRGDHPSSERISAAAMFGLAEPGAGVMAHKLERVAALLGFLQKQACFALRLGTPDASAAHILARVAELGPAA